MGEPLGVAVLGAGHMGADHVRRLDRVVSGARVAAVADPDAERAKEAAAGIDGVVVHTQAEAALDAPGVGAVLIASPGEAHEEALMAAFARGLPVLCEKPMVPDSAGALRVVEAEARLGRRLTQVGFMRRYDAEYLRLKSLLDGGRLGRPLMLHCVHRNVSSPPRFTSAMLINSSVSHEIDAARWLLGQELSAVTVLRPRPSAGAPEGLADPQLVLLETEGGAVVDVEVFVNCGFGYEVRCEAVCEKGSARIGRAHTMVVTAAGGAREEVPQDYLVRFADAYDREVQSWVDATRRGRVTGPGAWDGYAAAAVAEAGVRALETGARTPVELAPRPALHDPSGNIRPSNTGATGRPGPEPHQVP
ncbi:Gfo/Idh/MocA family protein [Streptomyces sp. CoH17]|uniref:Gfo/Idh/MocA family protein n=1 Tax=Streptomyces sp. CoH17 TaxID=2992806 RepID=UPI00226DA6AD|nr:Gfo/Idh/MocA family oxidoreductase [Streptomyces sp. CoH17]